MNFFVNKLEKEREIPNTLLFGNRVTFKPHDSFKFSLLRLAQFGGKDRPKDVGTILKMLAGRIIHQKIFLVMISLAIN